MGSSCTLVASRVTRFSKGSGRGSSSVAASSAGASGAALQTPREIIGLDAEASPEWIKTIAEQQETEQLFVVAVYENTTAWVSLHEKDENGEWKMIMSTPGFIGREVNKMRKGKNMSVGTNIKKRRFELRMSQQELADALGYKTRSTIARL